MKRVVPWMLLAASIGCQSSEQGDSSAGMSTSSVESDQGSESPPILFAKDGKVVSNFALISPSLQADMPKVLKPVVEVVGGKMPTLADLGVKRAMARKPAAQIDLRAVLGPVLQKDAADEEVTRAALAAEKHFAKHPEVATRTGHVARQIIAAGKLETYGTKTAQTFLKKWAKQFPEPKAKPAKKPARPERRSPAPKPTDS